MNLKRVPSALCALSLLCQPVRVQPCFGQNTGRIREQQQRRLLDHRRRGTEKAAKEFDVQVEFRKPPDPGTAADQQRIIEDLMSTGIKGHCA